MKKVLFCGPKLFPVRGGIQVYCSQMLSIGKNYLVFFETSKALYDKESWFNKILRIIFITFPFIIKLFFVKNVFINSSFDNRSLFRDLYFVLISKIFFKKCVLQFHGGLYSKATLFNSRFLLFLFKKIIVLCKTKVYVLSIIQKNDLYNSAGVFSTLNSNYTETNHKYRAKKLDGVLNIILLSRIDKSKGVFFILGVAKELKKHDIKFTFSVYGDGPDCDGLKEKICACNLDKYVLVKGYVEGDNKYKALASGNIFLMPTYHDEGIPLSILEAMSCGLPVISTSKGGLKDIIFNFKNGFILDLDVSLFTEKILFLYENRDILSDMGKNARQYVVKNHSLIKLKNSIKEIVYIS